MASGRKSDDPDAMILRGLLVVVSLCVGLLRAHAFQGQPPLLDKINGGIDEQPEVKAAQELVGWFEKNRYGVAYFDEIDVRMGGVAQDRSELGFRLKPTNPFYFAAGRNLGHVMEAQARVDLQAAYESAFQTKMVAWLKIRHTALLLHHADSALAWRAKWIQNMGQEVAIGRFDPEELLDLQLERVDLEVGRMNLMEELEDHLINFYEFTEHFSGKIEEEMIARLKQEQFPDMRATQLMANVQALEAGPALIPLELQKSQLAVEQAEARILLEKRDWDVGFVQPEWDNRGVERFGIRVGIGIPLFNTNRMQMQNRQLALIGDRWEQAKTKAGLNTGTVALYHKITSASDRLKALDDIQLQLEGYRKSMRDIEPADARDAMLRWLKAREKLQKRIIEDQFLLLLAYLDYLKLKGVLTTPEAMIHFENIW